MTDSLDEYYGRCQATVWEVEEILGPEATQRARHMRRHEPSEAMLALAHAIVQEEAEAPQQLLDRIRILGTPVPDDAWPSGFAGNLPDRS